MIAVALLVGAWLGFCSGNVFQIVIRDGWRRS